MGSICECKMRKDILVETVINGIRVILFYTSYSQAKA